MIGLIRNQARSHSMCLLSQLSIYSSQIISSHIPSNSNQGYKRFLSIKKYNDDDSSSKNNDDDSKSELVNKESIGGMLGNSLRDIFEDMDIYPTLKGALVELDFAG